MTLRRRFLMAAALLAVVAGLACKKQAEVTPGKAAAVLQGAPATHPPVEQSLGALPPGVAVVVGVQSLDALRAAGKALEDSLGVSGADALRALDVPAEFEAALDPARPLFAAAGAGAEGGFAAALPVKDAAPFQAAAGAGQVEVLDAGTPSAWAIMAESPAAAAALRPTLDKARAALKPQAPVQLIVSGQALRDAARPVLEELRRELVSDLSFSAAMSPLPMDGQAIGVFYGKWFERIDKLLGEIEVVDLRLGADAQRLRVEVLVGVKDGGTFRKLIARGEAGGSASAGLLPPNAWAVAAASVDPALFAGLKDESAAMLGAMTGGGTPSYEIAALYEAAYAVQTGDWAMALYQSEGFPFATAGVALTTDGAKFREAMNKFSDLYLNVMQSNIPAMPGGPPMDFSSWEKLFDGISSVSKAFGLSVEADSDGDVSGVRVGMNWNQLPMFGDPAALDRIKKVWGSKWELAFGFGPVVYSMCFGPAAFADAAQILKGGFTYADESFRASMGRGAAHPFAVAWLDTGRASNALADLIEQVLMEQDGPTAKDVAQKLRAAKPGDAIAFTMGGSGTTLHAVLDLPLAPLKDLSAVFQ